MQILLALIVVSFVFWFSAPQGDTTQDVARVNGTSIRDTDYFELYRRVARANERRMGRSLTDDEEAGLKSQVVDSLVRKEVIYQEGKRLGMEVSDSELLQRIKRDPQFQLEEGKYDSRRYKDYIRRRGVSAAKIEDEFRKELMIEKMGWLIGYGGTVSEAALREDYKKQASVIDVQYARVSPGAVQGSIEVTPGEVASWVAANTEAIQAAYDAEFEQSYNQPEKLQLSVIRLQKMEDGPNIAELEEILRGVREEIAGGADFVEKARMWSEDASVMEGGDMGLRSVATLPAEVRQAAAGMAVGALTDVISTERDVRIFKLVDRVEPNVIPLEEVRDEIALRLIRAEKAPERARELAASVLSAWTESGAPPVELLEAAGLTVQSTGPRPFESDVGMTGPPDDMMAAALAGSQGDVLPLVYVRQDASGGGQAHFVGAVLQRTEADMALFEDEKRVIEAEALLRHRSQVFLAWVDDLVAQATVEILI
jgi:peptidyl-prolyl cis-trans isomerase D